MAEAKKPAPRFTAREKDLIIDLVDQHKDVLECRQTDVSSTARKNQTWIKIAELYNSIHGVTARDAKQIKKFGGNLKQKWKVEKGQERRGRFKTGKRFLEQHFCDVA